MVAATGARLSNLTTSAAANASAAASTAASEASLWLGRRLSMGAQAVEAFVSKQSQQQQQQEQEQQPSESVDDSNPASSSSSSSPGYDGLLETALRWPSHSA
mmetsp:Transcript_19158/g.32378  ORF Transcript_19158/g.32378 Transcript_19158/m.32378 type:complete len:102 (+) Transcript_19158:332-637(+)